MNVLLNILLLVAYPTLLLSDISNVQDEPTDLKRYTDLKKALKNSEEVYFLDLSDKQLSTVPPEVSQLINLEILKLSNNKLTNLDDEIFTLKSLRYLIVNDNQLTELPKSIGQLKKLERLYLSNNKLKELPNEIYNLKKLEKLILENNDFTHETIKPYQDKMPNCTIVIEFIK